MVLYVCIVPNGKDAASFGQASLLLNATDSLLKDGGDLSGRGLSVGSIAAGERVDDGGRGLLLQEADATLARCP